MNELMVLSVTLRCILLFCKNPGESPEIISEEFIILVLYTGNHGVSTNANFEVLAPLCLNVVNYGKNHSPKM